MLSFQARPNCPAYVDWVSRVAQAVHDETSPAATCVLCSDEWPLARALTILPTRTGAKYRDVGTFGIATDKTN